jgi:hypothetical protein
MDITEVGRLQFWMAVSAPTGSAHTPKRPAEVATNRNQAWDERSALNLRFSRRLFRPYEPVRWRTSRPRESRTTVESTAIPETRTQRGQQDENCHDQSSEPLPKLEGRHRPKPQPRSKRHNGGVVHFKETSGSLVGDVRRQCQTKQNPGHSQLGEAWRSSDWCGNTHH